VSGISGILQAFPQRVELGPTAPMWEHLDLAENRCRLLLQVLLAKLRDVSTECWALHFKVTEKGQTVGVQVLEGEHFPELRIVDSASWLVPEACSRGSASACERQSWRWPSIISERPSLSRRPKRTAPPHGSHGSFRCYVEHVHHEVVLVAGTSALVSMTWTWRASASS
jgi:hypothetical protein